MTDQSVTYIVRCSCRGVGYNVFLTEADTLEWATAHSSHNWSVEER